MLGLDILHQVQSTFASYNNKKNFVNGNNITIPSCLNIHEKKIINYVYNKKLVTDNEKIIWDVISSKSEDLILKKIDTLIHALISWKAARS